MSHTRISGRGIVSCYGRGNDPVTAALRQGQSGIAPLRLFDLAFADDIKVNPIAREPYGKLWHALEAMLHQAVDDALQQAGHKPGDALEDCALIIGATSFLFISEAKYLEQLSQDPSRDHRPRLGSSGDISTALAQRYGIDGPVYNLHTACSSSANALLLAQELIDNGRVQRALVIGAEGLSRIALSGFYAMMLLDPEGCRPFDRQRRGLQLGEGFAALLLEAANDNRAPGAYILGGANLCDVHHVTSAGPDGSSMAHTMRQALEQAQIPLKAVCAIKAHGTGSQDNDLAEAAAMRSLFGDDIPTFTVLKRYLGHTLGACGALETATWLACLEQGFIPACLGYSQADSELALQPLDTTQAAGPGDYLLNFFGFGGNYASLVLRYV